MNLNFISLDNNDFEIKEIEINNTNNDLNNINLFLNNQFLFLLINNFYKIKDEITEEKIIDEIIEHDIEDKKIGRAHV